MDKKELLKQLIVTFQQSLPVQLFKRKQELPTDTEKIITVPGVRRCGKSSILMLTMNNLIENGLIKEKILFLNFDDERLNFKIDEFDLIIQAYRELYPEIPFNEVYLFFDEIQMSIGWEQFVRRVYDMETKHIFLTGSNAKLLSSEISTSLRGRTLSFEIFPLSFQEFCAFKNIDTNIYKTASRAIIIKSFYEYLLFGGFPEVVLNKAIDNDHLLQEYFFMMLYKDLIERYKIHNTTAVKYFIQRIFSNITKPSSIHKIYNELKSAGISVSKDLIYQLADQTEAIYLFFKLTRFDYSYLKETFSDRKYYSIDNGLKHALQSNIQKDYGQLLENTVFLWLRQQTLFQRGLHFYKIKKECDFVLFDKDKPMKLYQVCWTLNDKVTLQREISGLTEAADYLKCYDTTIVTIDEEKEIIHNNFTIKVIPAWKLML